MYKRQGLHNFSGMFLKKEVRRLFPQLLNWKKIEMVTNEVVRPSDILNLQQVMAANGDCSYYQAEQFLLLLSDTGYFNSMRIYRNLVLLNIPNNEIYQHLYKQHVVDKELIP